MAEKTILKSGLRIEGLGASYDGSTTLRGISVSIPAGQTVAMIGRSGVGKSTLFRCMSGLQRPSGGNAFLNDSQYMVDGRLLVPAWHVRRQIGLVFQSYNLFPNLTALENITLGLKRVRGLKPSEAKGLAEHGASLLGIQDLLLRYPSALSGGQAQRIALLRALVLSPEVLLLDEVTSSVDPETSHQMVETIQKLRAIEAEVTGGQQAATMTIILATHLYSFAESFAQRIMFMSEGQIVEDHLAADFRSNARHEDAKRYLEYAR